MSLEALTGIAVLFAISLMVRVLPAFVRLPFPPQVTERIEAVLPVAVLINLAVFCAASELEGAPLPAGLALLALVGLFAAMRRMPIIVLVLLASGIYLLTPRLLAA